MSTKKTRTVVEGARLLLAAPLAWVQGHYAVTSEGNLDLDPGDLMARCFCLAGALYAAKGKPTPDAGVLAQSIKPEAQFLGFEDEMDLQIWNDQQGRTHEEVLARIDEALA